MSKFYTRTILEKIAGKYCHGELVDVGAGRGKYQDILTPFITRYVAVDDLSSKYQYQQESDKSTIHVVAKADKMPFDDNSFDSALCTKVIEHVENPFSVVAEIARILKPGGYLILSSDWFTPYHREPKDYWRFTKDGYGALARASNLTVVECIQQGGLFYSFNYIFWRTIELQCGSVGRKLYKVLRPLRVIEEHLSNILDKLMPNPNGVGHVVVLKK